MDNNCLLFLSCTNYVWQIKKWMMVDHKIITAGWLPNNSLQFVTADGIYYSLHLTETLCTSSPGTQDWVAVIDYCKQFLRTVVIIHKLRYVLHVCLFLGSVLLTPFKQVIIPPPMFDLKLSLDSPVDSVLYLPDNQR